MNKLHPANQSQPQLQHKKKVFKPLAPPKSSPSTAQSNWNGIPQMKPNPVQSLHPLQPPRSFVTPLNGVRDEKGRSRSDKNVMSITPKPYPLNDVNSVLHHHVKQIPLARGRAGGVGNSNLDSPNRPKSRTVGDYEDQGYVSPSNEFMDDREVANKSFAYDRSLRKQRPPNCNRSDDDLDFGNNEQYQRMMDKMSFKCDQLDWNLNALQTNTDKDIRQITAKMHRVEHDMKTQNELLNRSHRKNGHGRRNSIFNSLESSIGAVMRNVDSIKDALQTLDLRMSIINQRQHDIFKHIDETKEILENAKATQSDRDDSKSGGRDTSALVLNALDKESLINSRRASLQSMSEMLRIQSTRSMSRQEEIEENNPLILPTYDDNEDILSHKSPTKKKLMGHIRPELLLEAQKSVKEQSGRPKILPPPDQRNMSKPGDQSYVIQKDKSHDITLSQLSSAGSGEYRIAIERTVTTPIYGIGPQLQGLHGIQNDILTLENITSTSSQSNKNNNNNNNPLGLLPPNQNENNLIPSRDLMKLHSIVEKEDDGTSTESELSLERNTAPISVPPMGSDEEDDGKQPEAKKQTSLSRRSAKNKKQQKHTRSSIDSGLSDGVIDKIRSETVLIHSDSEELQKIAKDLDLEQEDDEKAMEYNATPGGKDEDEEKHYILNKENRRKNKKRRTTHKRSMNEETSLNNIDMKTLEVPLPGTNKDKPKVSNSRKYSESYSINIHQQHHQNTTTQAGTQLLPFRKRKTPRQKEPSIFDSVAGRDRGRAGSMSYDAIAPNVKYEREVSRSDGNSGLMNDLDPLSFKNQQQIDKNRNASIQPLLPPVTDSDHENEEEDDSMSELSEDNGTFIIHGDTLKKEMDKEKLKEQQKQFEQEQSKKSDEQHTPKQKRRKSKKSKHKMISLMNCQFILENVPSQFTIVNDFILKELTQKPSYLLTICNNTTSHDLFFKTSEIFQCKSKALRFFRESNDDNNENKDNDDIIIIDENNDSDDHLAPMEDMTFGDVNIKKGVHYCGYFVFEAYPFITNLTDNSDGRSRQASTVITPGPKNNPITPQLKIHANLNAIDEKQRAIHKQQDYNQFSELKLGSMSPSTVNKYRRQSISSNASSRRTSLQFLSPKKGITLSDRVNVNSNSNNNNNHQHHNNQTYEPSVTSLLGRALDEEQNDGNGLPWNDEFDDLIDIIVGYDIVLSVGDAELNSFKCFIQFNQYQQPLFYQNKLYNLNALDTFCNGGGNGIQCRGGINNQLLLKCNINDKNSMHPQIQFNIGYCHKSDEELSNTTHTTNPETFDID